MHNQTWQKICTSAPREEELWELFHVNSRASLLDKPLPNQVVANRMLEMAASLHYADRPSFALPEERDAMNVDLQRALSARRTCRTLKSSPLAMKTLASLLHAGYGETLDNADGLFPRPFRSVPSAGALYPLELYFHTVHAEGLDAGLYHFDPTERLVRLVREGDGSRFISEGLVQRSLPFDASAIVFITGLPRRATFKYGNRGYRFMLLEAGHVAQNLALAACGLGLSSLCVGGFIDTRIDEFLGLDGLNHASLYLVAIGKQDDQDDAAADSGLVL